MGRTNTSISSPMEIGFLIAPEFPACALTLATEVLRVANQNAGRKLFDWRIISADGEAVVGANGLSLEADLSVSDMESLVHLSLVFVCFGNHPMQYLDAKTLGCLRQLDRHGITLGAMDTGIFALAEAGLLDGFKVTLHWEAIPIFLEEYPNIEVLEQIIVFDRNRITCSGGTNTLDMILHIVGNNYGWDLAQIVANGFVHSQIREVTESQRQIIIPDPYTTDALVDLIVHTMENNIESPLSRQALASQCRTTTRRMERIFLRKFNNSPMRFYLSIRLQAARKLLFYSNMPISEVSLVCGFSSPPLFSRVFRKQFNQSPREYRASLSTDRLRRFFPEHVQKKALENNNID